jgi:maleylpyruvate isomerase
MRLYSYFRSSAAYRVRIALGLKGLAAEPIPINLRDGQQASSDYRMLNPEGLVPMLEDGAITITQSVAIMEYLEEAYPTPALLPKEVAARARVRALVQMITSDIHPLNNLRVLKYLIGPAGMSKAAKDDWYRHWIHVGLTAVEARLDSTSTGLFCHGNSPGLADCVLVPQVYNAVQMQCDLSTMPRLQSIVARCNELPAFQQAHPDRCPA